MLTLTSTTEQKKPFVIVVFYVIQWSMSPGAAGHKKISQGPRVWHTWSTSTTSTTIAILI